MTKEERTNIFGESYAKHYELYEMWHKQAMNALNILKEAFAEEDYERYLYYSKMANKHYGIASAIATKKINRYRV